MNLLVETVATDPRALAIRDDVALAIYKVDHPDYTSPDMGGVPLLATVQHYRRLADAAMPFIGSTYTDTPTK